MEDLILRIMNYTVQATTLGYFTHRLVRETGDKKQSTLRIVLYYILIIVEMMFVMFLRKNYSIYNTISFMVTAIIGMIFCLKVHPVKATIITTVTAVIFGLSELVVTTLGMIGFHVDFTTIMASQPKMLIVIIFESVFDFLVLALFVFIIRKIKNLECTFKSISKKQFLTLSIVLSIYLIPQIIIFNIDNFQYPTPFLVINTVQFIGIMLFLFIYFKRDNELDKAQNELFTSELHNRTMIGVIDGVDTLKHDYNNVMHILDGYIREHQYDQLQNYLNQLLGECKQVNNLSIINEEIFNEPAIYGIVGAKYFVATEANIPFDLVVKTDIKDIPFPMPELSRILGILMDNAIEATSKVEDKYMKLEFLFDERKCADIIRITNTFDPNIKIDVKEIFKRGVSTKEIKSGIGLWEVQKLMEKQGNATIDTTIQNNKFTHEITFDFMD